MCRGNITAEFGVAASYNNNYLCLDIFCSITVFVYINIIADDMLCNGMGERNKTKNRK